MVGRPVAEELALLTEREQAVLGAMAEGQSNLGIARSLIISLAAVEKHVTAIFRKLGLSSRDASTAGSRRFFASCPRKGREP